MIIQLKHDVTGNQFSRIETCLGEYGFAASRVRTQQGDYLIALGKKDFDIRRIGTLDGVKDIHIVSDPYQLVSRKWKVKTTCIDLGDGVKIQEGDFAIMAGPCSIESEEQIESTIGHLKANDIRIMRGGVYKPRSSPYSFRGHGMDLLVPFYEKCKANGIKVLTEVMQVSQIDEMHDYVDIFQVGARNCQNFNLLDELGKSDRAVLLKRGMSMTMEELLQAAEYLFSNGNERIMLCERGIRTFEHEYRNTLDINAIPMLKEKSHLPVIVDPSHGIGLRRFVEPLCVAATVSGADGIIVEVHESPEKALSDGQQTLNYAESTRMIRKVRAAHELYQKMRDWD